MGGDSPRHLHPALELEAEVSHREPGGGDRPRPAQGRHEVFDIFRRQPTGGQEGRRTLGVTDDVTLCDNMTGDR